MSPFLSEQSRAALERLAAGESEETPPPPLDRVRGIRSLVAALDIEPEVLRAVREAIEHSASWDDIAAASSLGPAAAKWRWQGTDAEIAARHAAGRKRSARPSSVPTDLPGMSVAEAARVLGVSPAAVYLRITRGTLEATTVELEDGRRYKRVLLDID